MKRLLNVSAVFFPIGCDRHVRWDVKWYLMGNDFVGTSPGNGKQCPLFAFLKPRVLGFAVIQQQMGSVGFFDIFNTVDDSQRSGPLLNDAGSDVVQVHGNYRLVTTVSAKP